MAKLTVPAVGRCIDRLLERRSEHTARAYLADLRAFMAFAHEETPADALCMLLTLGRVDARHLVERYEAAIAGRKAQATVRRRIAALQALVAAARRDGLVDWRLEVDRTARLSEETKKATSQRKMAGPTPAEIQKVRELLVRENTPASTRDLAMMALLVNPMLRRAELARLQVGDFDLEDPESATVRIRGKGRSETEELDLDPKVVRDVRAWLDVRRGHGTDPAFVAVHGPKIGLEQLDESSVYLIMLRRGREAGLKKRFRPHGLRHAGITQVANYISEHGIPVTEGMAISRHKDAKTFWGYVDRKGSQRRRILGAVAARVS